MDDSLQRLEFIDIYRFLQQKDKALAEINQILQSDPDWTDIKFLQGSIMLENKDLTGAKQIYEELKKSEEHKFLKDLLALEIAFYKEDFDLAEDICKKLIKDFPDNLNIQVSLFNIYLQKKDFATAKEVIKDISKNFPKEFSSLSLFGDFYLAQQNFNDAVKYYQKYMRDNPYVNEGYYRLAHVYRNQGQYDLSNDIYRQAIEVFPNSYSFHKLLARGLRDRGVYKKSVKEYKKAIELLPSQVGAHIGLGSTYTSMGEADLAITEYKKAFVIEPKNSEIYWGLANAYLLNKQYEKTIEYSKKGIELNKDEELSYYTLARAYNETDRKNQAKDVCGHFTKNPYADAEDFSYAGWCFAGIEMYDEAFEAYRQADTKSKGFKHIYNQLAWISAIRKDFTSAVFYAKKILKINPDDDYGLRQLSVGYLGLGNIKKAEEANQKIFDKYVDNGKTLAGKYVEFSVNLMGYQDKLKYVLKAEEYLKKALELDPSQYEIYIVLGDLYENGKHFASREKKEEALSLYEKAFQIDGGIIPLAKIVMAMDDLGQKKKSLEYVKNVVDAEPAFYEAHILLIEQYQAVAKYKEAITESLKLIAKDPNSARAYDYLGISYSYSRNYYEALQAWKKSNELDSANPLVYVNLAFTYRTIGSWLQVINAGNKAIELGYKEGAMFETVAIAYHQQGMMVKALDYFKQAIEISPESCAQNSIGYFYLTQNKYKNALPHLLKAVKYCEDVDKSKAYYNLSSVYSRLSNPIKAEAAYRKSKELGQKTVIN